MNDADIVRDYYKTLVQQAFDAYWNDAFIGDPSPTEIQQAETTFRNQITSARQARDRAIALLPP